MALESVGNVVATVLRRSDTNEMSLSSLHPFCVRLFFEHLLPSSQLSNQDLPVELANPASLLHYLRVWDENVIAIVGEEGSWSARLVQPYTGVQTQMHPKNADTSSVVKDAEQPLDYESQVSYSPYDPHPQSSKATNGVSSESVSTDSKNGEWDETTYVRQLVCTTLLDYVLHTQGAVHYHAAAELEETRSQCIQLLVKAFPEAPPELLSEEGLADLLLSQGNKYMITVSAGRRKMVFKQTEGVPQDLVFQSQADQQAGKRFPMAQMPHMPNAGYFEGPRDYAGSKDGVVTEILSDKNPQTPSPVPPIPTKESSATSVVSCSTATTPLKPTEQAPTPQPLPQPAARTEASEADIVSNAAAAYLRKHKIFDGPKSMPVEKLRSVLVSEKGQPVDANSPLASLSAFRALLATMPAITVWVSKASDVLRCMMDPDASAGREKGATAANSPAKLSELVAGAPSIYKAAHLYLVAQQPVASSAETAVKIHVLLKAIRSFSVGTSWHSHPGLQSIPHMLRYMKQDTSLVFSDDTPTKDGSAKDSATSVWIKPQHGSFKVALKTLQSGSHVDASEAGASGSAGEPTLGSTNTTGDPIPTSMPSGYTQLGTNIEVWGPTSNLQVLRSFLAQYGATRMWGFDYKTTTAPKSHVPSTSQVTLLTLATCRACLLWDLASGSLPEELEGWLQDSNIRKCRMSAKGSANVLAGSLNIVPAGFLDLRELLKLSLEDELTDVRFSSFAGCSAAGCICLY